MKSLNAILTEITELTNTIESDYPELYRFLDENPMTLPADEHPEINQKVMQEYLESLKKMLAHHLETHRIKKIIDPPSERRIGPLHSE